MAVLWLMSALVNIAQTPLTTDAANLKGLLMKRCAVEALGRFAVAYTCQQCVSRTSPHKKQEQKTKTRVGSWQLAGWWSCRVKKMAVEARKKYLYPANRASEVLRHC